MSCTYHVEKDDHGIYDVLEDSEAGIRIRVLRKGAELVSLALANPNGGWTGFLHRDNDTTPPPSGWANHATVMGYFLHRLIGQRTTYRGHVIEGGNHGFLRSFEFDSPRFIAHERAIRYAVPAHRIPPAAYPLRVPMNLDYRLEGTSLRVAFEFHNDEVDLPAHVSFGLHPGFVVSSVEAAEIHLPAGTYVRHWAPGNFLDGRVEHIDFGGGPMPFAKTKLPDSFILGLEHVPAPIIELRDSERRTGIDLDFRGVPYMTLWSDMGPFVCIEPCWGLPDSIPQKPFEDKDGIQVIPPGGMLRGEFSMRPLFL